MNSEKPLSFNGTALDYLVLTVISIVLVYIPFFGWALLLNYTAKWFTDKSLVNGKKVTYQAGYGETLKFVLLHGLLLLVTLGIYSFWFYPKMYRYMVDHVCYLGDEVAAPVAQPVVSTEVPASAETASSATTTPPTNSVQ